MNFPDDDNGAVLRRLMNQGDPLTEPRDIDFVVVFPNEFSAMRFADVIRNLGYVVSIDEAKVEPGLPWDVCVVKNMIPSHEGITEFEELLEDAAEPFGGKNDGWGCFGQPTTH